MRCISGLGIVNTVLVLQSGTNVLSPGPVDTPMFDE
jgi:hypothetical protein